MQLGFIESTNSAAGLPFESQWFLPEQMQSTETSEQRPRLHMYPTQRSHIHLHWRQSQASNTKTGVNIIPEEKKKLTITSGSIMSH